MPSNQGNSRESGLLDRPEAAVPMETPWTKPLYPFFFFFTSVTVSANMSGFGDYSKLDLARMQAELDQETEVK